VILNYKLHFGLIIIVFANNVINTLE